MKLENEARRIALPFIRMDLVVKSFQKMDYADRKWVIARLTWEHENLLRLPVITPRKRGRPKGKQK